MLILAATMHLSKLCNNSSMLALYEEPSKSVIYIHSGTEQQYWKPGRKVSPRPCGFHWLLTAVLSPKLVEKLYLLEKLSYSMISKKKGVGGTEREKENKFTFSYSHKDSVTKLYYISPRMCLYSM